MFRTQTNEDLFLAALQRIAAALERQLVKQAEPVEQPPVYTFYNIQQLLRAGQKIEAIKMFRTLTGAGLKDAKDVIDRME